MLKLTNIKKTSRHISANYIPEDTGELGFVKIELETDDVIEKKLTSSDKVTETYFAMTRDVLSKIKNDDDFSEDRLIMWY